MSALSAIRVLGPILLFVFSVAFAGAASASDLRIANGRIVLPMGGESPSVYFAIQSKSKETRTIVGASSPRAESVVIRRTAVDENGQWGSQGMPEGMPIPPNAAVAFAPRGLFLRMMSPDALVAGETVEIILEFKDGERVPFEATVKTP